MAAAEVTPTPIGVASPQVELVSPQLKYGRDAIRTPSNFLSLSRIIGGPILGGMYLMADKPSWSLFAAHLALWSTDMMDGKLARRQGTTQLGEDLDKMGDKFYTTSNFISQIAKGTISWVPVAIMGVRDYALGQYRRKLKKDDISTAAEWPGKVKTSIQLAAISVALAPPVAENIEVVNKSVWIAALASVASGIWYFAKGRKERRAKRSEKQKLTPVV